jgi:hypothetical protein
MGDNCILPVDILRLRGVKESFPGVILLVCFGIVSGVLRDETGGVLPEIGVLGFGLDLELVDDPDLRTLLVVFVMVVWFTVSDDLAESFVENELLSLDGSGS